MYDLTPYQSLLIHDIEFALDLCREKRYSSLEFHLNRMVENCKNDIKEYKTALENIGLGTKKDQASGLRELIFGMARDSFNKMAGG